MKNIIQNLIKKSLEKTYAADKTIINSIEISICKNKKFGDFSSNIAMKLSSKYGENPRIFAEKIVSKIEKNSNILKIEIANPGFINFYISKDTQYAVIEKILKEKNLFGKNNSGESSKILIEFISANPTGPLHVGHGRGAAFGDVISNLLNENGYDVVKEYYVNDAGKQVDILTISVLQRYHELVDKNFEFSYDELYQGDYIWDIAAEIHRNYKLEFYINNLKNNYDEFIDKYIDNVKNILSLKKFNHIKTISVDLILKDIKKTLNNTGINFDSWFFESSLLKNDNLSNIINYLKENNFTYKKDKALWFRSEDLGDEKDRVLIKENNDHTYLATDIAYHHNKIHRNFEKIINIWGADHHGYIPRIQNAFDIFARGKSKLIILLVQFANLFRGDEKISMSTRSGEFITLDHLLKEVGKDATRFFYLTRKSDQHMDFDIELAKSNNNNNPVFYIQYAHARICGIFKLLEEKRIKFNHNKEFLRLLIEAEELSIIKKLSLYPDIITISAKKYEPHLLANYMRELSQEIHAYYNKFQIIIDEDNLRNSRLSLMQASKYVLQNSSRIVGINMPEKM